MYKLAMYKNSFLSCFAFISFPNQALFSSTSQRRTALVPLLISIDLYMAPGGRTRSQNRRSEPEILQPPPSDTTEGAVNNRPQKRRRNGEMPQSPPSDTAEEVANPVRNVRGKNRGVELDKLTRVAGKKPAITIDETDKRPVGKFHEKLSREVGIIVREFAPHNHKSWYHIPLDERQVVYERVLTKLDLDWDKRVVRECVDEIAYDRFKDFRCKVLAKHYKEMGGGEVARRFPPEQLIDRKEQWLWLCDFFESDSFKKRSTANAQNRAKLPYVHKNGSKSFPATRHKMKCNSIDLFKICYLGAKGWANEEAENRFNKMVELKEAPVHEGEEARTAEQICSQVLGVRSGYIPGCGRGPKPPGQREKTPYFEPLDKHLEEELENTKSVIETQKVQLEAQKTQIEQQHGEIQAQKAQMEAQQTEIKAQKVQIEVQKEEIEAHKGEMKEQKSLLETQGSELAWLKEYVLTN